MSLSNMIKAYQTKDERREYENEKHKKYYRQSSEKRQQTSDYNKTQYYKNHELTLQRENTYRLNHRDKILEKNKMPVVCECGCTVTYNGLPKHRKSAKHTKLLEQQNAKTPPVI